MSDEIPCLLSIEGLRTYFFISEGILKAADGVNLEVLEGQKVGLVGESGSGKSVTALSVMKLIPNPPGKIVGGKIIFKGKNLLELTGDQLRKVRGKQISMVFQNPTTYLNPVLKVGDQIAEAVSSDKGLSKKEKRDKVEEILGLVRIPTSKEVFDYYPHQLSGGMQQRVLISMALISKPSLLIADEPTTALDATVQTQILDLIKKLADELGFSLLLITHDLGIMAEIVDAVYVMYAGKIIENADVYSIFETPKHPYTVGLLRSTLSIDELKENLYTIGGTVPNLLNPPTGCRFHPRCPKAIEKCRRHEPPEIELEGGHHVSCWLHR